MATKPRRYGQSWTREELILAFDLYFRTPFARTKASNPDVIKLARSLERSPASIARKLGNFGSFDPALKAEGITGLSHASHLDEQVWQEFNEDWARLAEEADELKSVYGLHTEPSEAELELPSGPSEVTVLAKRRLHQSFFRDAVRANYDNRCCLTGLRISQCLVASHIVPWSRDERYQADPTNGLCLSATFDRLFDSGMLTFTSNLTAAFAAELKKKNDEAVETLILRFEGCRIAKPSKLMPSTERLAWHRENVFKG